MAEAEKLRIVPFPEIPRYPGERGRTRGEPKLAGAPQRPQESIILTTPGLSQALDVIVDLKGANSQVRSKYLERVQRAAPNRPRQHADLVDALGKISGDSITDSPALKSQAGLVYEKLKPEDESVRYIVGHAFLDDLQDFGSFSVVINRFGEYAASDEKKKKGVVKNQAKELFNNPKALVNHSISASVVVDLLEEDQSVQAKAYRAYDQEVRLALTDLAAKPEFAPLERKNLTQWMRVLCAGTRYSSIAEGLLKKWLEVRDPDAAVDRIHQLTTAALTFENTTIDNKMIDILGLHTDILPFDSQAAIDFSVAHAVGSLKARQQRAEVLDAQKIAVPSDGTFNQLRYSRQIHSEATKAQMPDLRREIIRQAGTSSTQRLFWERVRERSFRSTSRRTKAQKTITELDTDKLMTDSPLRQWINEKVAQTHRTQKLGRKRILQGEIQLPGTARVIKAPVDQVVDDVKSKLDQLSGHELDQPGHWRTLALLVPRDIDQQKIDKLHAANEAMRREILEDRLRGISKRGDRIHITNPKLHELGFTTVEVFPEELNGYQVRLKVGDNTFVGAMDKEWHILHPEYGSQLRMPITGAFLEQVILSHVHELTCAPAAEGGNGEETRNQFYSRRDHQHRLPEGQKPSEKRILQAWVDYGIDLNERNRARLESGETTLVTWNSAVDRIDMAGKGPVESHAQSATDKLEAIFA